MALDWFLYAVTATFLWSLAAIILKFVRVKYIKSTIGYMVITSPMALLGLLLLFFGRVQIPSTKYIIYIIITAFTGIAAYGLYIAAIHKEEISRVITLYNAIPLVTLILATIFLKEILTLKDYLAFPLIIIGSTLISIKKVENKLILSKGISLVLISLFLFSVQAIILKIAADVDYISFMIIRWLAMLLIVILIFISSNWVRNKVKQTIKQLNKKRLCLIYTAEAMGMIGFIFSYLAIQRGPVSLVSLVQGTESLFVIVLAAFISIFMPHILKEEINKKTMALKIISALLIIIGLYMIAI
ncbi:MAG: EamA family transporter [Promethearchaeota archaeon]|jgi:drug/metabolite transporter (DMT)-like permease